MEKPKEFKSRAEWEKFLWQKIIGELSHSGSPEHTKNFLEGLLSEYERKFMMRRLTAILLLKEGLTYREVSRILWVSPNAISHIKKSFAKRSGYASWTKTAPNAHPKTDDKKSTFSKKALGVLGSFLTNLAEFAVAAHNGYADRKKLWRFLSK
mgnify:CR=1 FL=1